MNKRVFALLLLLVGVLQTTPLVAEERENSQEVVLGLGLLGLHLFSSGDDFRNDGGALGMDLDFAGSGSLYAEWYLWDRFGLGARVQLIGVEERSGICIFGSCSYEVRKVDIHNYFLTANWLALISRNDYTRVVVIGGVGPSSYDISQSGDGGSYSGGSSTTALMAGLYVDWGGDDFGARLGAELLRADHGTVDGMDLDASGISYNLELRWAL